MTADLKPYPNYKPSGIEWLGDVPAHWDVAAVKRHYSIQLGKMLQNFPRSPKDVEVPYLKAQHVQWFAVRTTDVPTMWASPYETEQFGIRAGDLLVCEGGEGGRCSLVKEVPPSCIIQNALHRVRALGTGRNDYLQYVMSTISQMGWFDAINNKATIAHFTVGKFGSLKIPIPPLAEQAAIVRYLDHTDGRIRRYLRSRERLIELLKEYRQAVIHETVTQGLDPDVPLKPSGVEWLGDVPAHWEVRRVKHAFRRIVGGSTPSSNEAAYWDGTIVWVTPTDISKVTRLRDSLRRITKKGFDSCSTTLVPVGSLVVTSRAPVGNVALTEVPLCTNQGCKTLVPDSQVIDSNYGYQVFGILQDELQSLANGTTFTEISTNALGNVHLPIPPLAEQAAIAAYLDKQTAAIAAAITRAQREIELLSEYRTRLIADVVTGQVDVREAMGGLSDGCDTKTARAEYATD